MLRRASGYLLSLVIVLLALGVSPGFTEDKPTKGKEKPKGPRYVNKQAGVAARGPAGWKMAADKGGPVEWSRLVTFYDPDTDSDIVFSVRKKSTSSVQALLARVRKEWGQSNRMRVSAMRAVERDALVKVAHVIVDGKFTLKPKAKKGGVPPPPVSYRVNATYYLGPDGEYLLYAKAQETHWSRVGPRLRKVRDSIKFSQAVAKVVEGAGTYRNAKLGFTCTYPPDASVIVSEYENQIVGFVPLSGDEPTFDVYRINYSGTIDDDAKRLVAFYVEDQGGEAEQGDTFVAGKEATLVKATAEIGGLNRVIRLVSFKRNDGSTWRIKASGPEGQDAKVDAALKHFIDNFKLTRASKR